jgi:hypothetical protein
MNFRKRDVFRTAALLDNFNFGRRFEACLCEVCAVPAKDIIW